MDVTARLLTYREAARGLWNNFLRRELKREVDFEAVGRFDAICEALFDDLVLRPLGLVEVELPDRGEACPFLVVRLASPDARVQVHRPTADGRYWDDPVKRLKADGLRLHFIDFYDFDDFGFIDFEYFRVRIAECAEHPHLVGRQALIEVTHALVEFENAGSTPEGSAGPDPEVRPTDPGQRRGPELGAVPRNRGGP